MKRVRLAIIVLAVSALILGSRAQQFIGGDAGTILFYSGIFFSGFIVGAWLQMETGK